MRRITTSPGTHRRNSRACWNCSDAAFGVVAARSGRFRVPVGSVHSAPCVSAVPRAEGRAKIGVCRTAHKAGAQPERRPQEAKQVMDAVTTVPVPVNEPVHTYAPG